MSELDASTAPAGAADPTPVESEQAFDSPRRPRPQPGSRTQGRRPDSWFDGLESLDRTAVDAPQLTRRGRLRKWDRPKPPKDWRWWVGNLGRTLIATGLLMFGFVAYQLWGTGIETARAQNELESEFDMLLANAPAVVSPDPTPRDDSSTDPADPPTTGGDEQDAGDATDVEPGPDAPSDPNEPVRPVPVDEQNIPALENGDALARLEIPRIGRSDIVVAGVTTSDLKRGPGHFPDTPLPGQLGNAAIAGHRTTYGAPFFDVDDLQVGDDIIVTTLSGTFTYRVTGSEIVASSRYDVVATSDPSRATLTLISCHPKYTAQQRIVVFSELVTTESGPVGEPIINYGRADDIDTAPAADTALPPDTELPAGTDESTDTGSAGTAPSATDGSVTGTLDDISVVDDPGVLEPDQVSNEIVDAFSDGWFSDPAANAQVGLWGALLALIGIGAYLVSRRLRRDWIGALVGVVPFVVTLYFFFQNVNRLLPPNL